MKKYCYFNGKITEEKNMHISPYDLGVLRGYAVFDFMCTANGKPFHLRDHWLRFKKSAKELRLTIPITQKEYTEIIERLLHKNKIAHAAIRTVLTGGTSSDGISLSQDSTFFIMIHDMDPILPDPRLYESGAKIITHHFARNPHMCKTTNYIEAIRNHKKRDQKKAIEILYISDNAVLECSTSNIFIIKNNTLVTPADGVLGGITRKIVLSLAQKNNIKTKESRITPKQLLSADEVFITGSAKHILPVTKIDDATIGNGEVGTLTKELRALYLDHLNSY